MIVPTDCVEVGPCSEPSSDHFLQTCPACGRTASIEVEYTGCDVYCGHCLCQFLARDPSTTGEAAAPTPSLLERAELLLRSLEPPIVRISGLRQ